MSLSKQLWLAVIILLTLVFGASLVVSSLSARGYLEQQLSIKNADNANMLALLLSQQGDDRAGQEQILANQFGTGFYEIIQLADTAGDEVIRLEDNRGISGAPAWFVRLLPVRGDAGAAAVRTGDRQAGTVTVRSHSGFAYHQLWEGAWRLALIFLAAIVAAGSLGTYFLKIVLRPLEDLAQQAKAIGERRFVSMDPPRAQEFGEVVTAMNRLSGNVRKMLAQEGSKLEQIQRDARTDKVTGLINREPFMQSLASALQRNDASAMGSLGLVRIRGLAQLNQVYGRKAIDAMLKDAGTTLSRFAMQHTGWAIARLNGSDLAVLAPRETTASAATGSIRDVLREVLRNHSMPDDLRLPAAATVYNARDTIPELMTRLDGALLAADKEGAAAISVTQRGDIEMKPVREQMDAWRKIFNRAFADNTFTLAGYPLVGLEGQVVHLESPVRLRWKDEELAAGEFLPWINRLELAGELDQHVVALALKKIAVEGVPVCVNLSARSLVDPAFFSWLSEQLSSQSQAAGKLWLEVPEAIVFRHLDRFRQLVARSREHGSKIGIEHVGHELKELGRLHDVGVDFLKIDSAFVLGVDDNVANQTIIRTLCTVSHAIGLQVFAEGVQTPAEWATLRELGADGATGPGIAA